VLLRQLALVSVICEADRVDMCTGCTDDGTRSCGCRCCNDDSASCSSCNAWDYYQYLDEDGGYLRTGLCYSGIDRDAFISGCQLDCDFECRYKQLIFCQNLRCKPSSSSLDFAEQ